MNKSLLLLALFALFASTNAVWDWGLTGNTNNDTSGHNLGFGQFGFHEALNFSANASTPEIDEAAIAAAVAQALAEALGSALNGGGSTGTPVISVTPVVVQESQEEKAKKKLKNEMLFGHNFHRKAVGSPELEWDNELAETAKMYAERFERQNMLEKDYNEPGLLASVVLYERGATAAVFDWTSGKSKMKCYPFMENPGRYPNVYDQWSKEKDIFAYTQVVWKATKLIGCAQSGKYFVCKYYPRGNYYGVAPF